MASLADARDALEWRLILAAHAAEWDGLTAREVRVRLAALGYDRSESTISRARREMVLAGGGGEPPAEDAAAAEQVEVLDRLLRDRDAQREYSNRVMVRALARCAEALEQPDVNLQMSAARTAAILAGIYNRQNGLSVPERERPSLAAARRPIDAVSSPRPA